MATYIVALDAGAADRFGEDNALSRFQAYLLTHGVTLDAGGGVALATTHTDEATGTVTAGPLAIIDATADPTTPAQAYSWSYAGSTGLADELSTMQYLVSHAGTADLYVDVIPAIVALMKYLGIPLSY